MTIERTIEISSQAKDVWKVLAEGFVGVDEWMAGVGNSVEINKGKKAQNAPTIGRMAEVAINPGTFMDERISTYDAGDMTLVVNTTFLDIKGPLNGYDTVIKVRALGPQKSEVTWTSKTSFGLLGYPLYFVIKKGLSDGFFRGLEELKHFVETGRPHERKLAAPHCG